MNKTKAELALEQYLAGLTEKHLKQSDNLLLAHNAEWRKKISDTLKGKSLEELLGEARAAQGRQRRSESFKGKKRPEAVGQKIAEGRRTNGSYDGRSMRGKTHKESTKEIQSIKAQIRQDLKRQLGLGRNDKIPKELLEQEYQKLTLNNPGIEK